jgi:FG-GAP-like repeat
VVAGPGGGVRLEVTDDGTRGTVVHDHPWSAAENMNKGQYVAIGDINNDGYGDIVVSTDKGRSSFVKAYNGQSNALLKQFQPYASGFTGGTRVAVGDVNGDGFGEIITGAGPGGGPHVQAFSGTNNAVIQQFFAYVESFSVGIFVAAGDVDGDGKADIITGPEVTGGAHVQVFQGGTSVPIRGFFVGEPTVPNQQPITVGSGARVAAADIDGDGVVEILTGRGRGVKPLAQMIKVSSRNTTTGVVTSTLTTPLVVNPFGDGYLDGIFVG